MLNESAIEILFSDFGVSKGSETFSITIPPTLQVPQENKSAKSLISLWEVIAFAGNKNFVGSES